MNCRNIKRILCNTINNKSMSSFKHISPEQLYCCFNRDPSKNVRSVKFVPREEPLKVPAGKYHESNSQEIIHERMLNLHKTYKLGEGFESQILTKRLQNLMHTGQRSFMNLSTEKKVESRITSSARNSFPFKSNQSVFSYSQKPDQYSLLNPEIYGNVTNTKRYFTAYSKIGENTVPLSDKAEPKDIKEAELLEPSTLSQFVEHTKKWGEEESLVDLVPKTEMNTGDSEMKISDDREIDFKLMDVNLFSPYLSSLQENNPDRHIIQITTRNAADAEGVYYAP